MSRFGANEERTEAMPVRSLTTARVVALMVIGLLVAGLAYVRLAPAQDAMAVPAGAKAGDLLLEPCEYPTEDGVYAADCGTLVVPEHRADPDSRLIAVPVTRVRTLSAQPAEPVFRLEGGPGITNMEFDKASRFAENRDVVLVGYRGVDGSERLDCPEVSSALSQLTDPLSEETFQAYADGFAACADRLTGEGVDLAGYGLTQQVDDLEAARVALGYGRINLVSESAGTRTAQIYAWRYPGSIHRSVMIGVNPPGNFVWEPPTTDQQIGAYADLCAQDDECRRRTDDLAATMRRIGADIPDRWFFLPIRAGSVRVFSFYGLMESSPSQAPMSGPVTLDAWLSAAEGDPSGFWFQSLFADLFPIPFVWGQYAAAARPDAAAVRDYFSAEWPDRDANLGYAASAFTWGGGRLADGWPAAPDESDYSRVRSSEVETLLVGGALDFSTPPQVASKELLPYLPNGQEIVLPWLGHSASFWADQPEAGTRLINTFFDTGLVDDSLYQPQQVDFTPGTTLTEAGKVVASVMVGLALLTVVSLLWMARRVYVRGGVGPLASATLRSVYAVVLGLGGWCLGVLVVGSVFTSVGLDNELVVAGSMGASSGLGIFLAWVNRDRPAAMTRAGLAVALGGGVVGAWFGFNATVGLAALATATIGATLGPNLALLVVDITTERSGRHRPAVESQSLARNAAQESSAGGAGRR